MDDSDFRKLLAKVEELKKGKSFDLIGIITFINYFNSAFLDFVHLTSKPSMMLPEIIFWPIWASFDNI